MFWLKMSLIEIKITIPSCCDFVTMRVDRTTIKSSVFITYRFSIIKIILLQWIIIFTKIKDITLFSLEKCGNLHIKVSDRIECSAFLVIICLGHWIFKIFLARIKIIFDAKILVFMLQPIQLKKIKKIVNSQLFFFSII